MQKIPTRDQLKIFLEDNLKEFAKMQGDTNLQRIFGLYNKAGSFKRATDDDKKAIESNSSKINAELQKTVTKQELKTFNWEAVHTNAATYFGSDPAKTHDLICYAANRLEIKLDKDVSDVDLGRISKFISFIPWLLKNMPETAKNSEFYKLPEWLRNQEGPASLKDEDVKAWYKKILEKKTEVASAEKTDKKNDDELQITKVNETSRSDLGEKLTSDKKASEERSGTQA